MLEKRPDGSVVEVVSRHEYDALNRRVASSDGLGNRTDLSYDARGNVTFLVDPGKNLTVQQYDGLDRLLERVQPEGIAEVFGYDRSSRLTSYRDALGNVTRFEHDDLGRQKAVVHADGVRERFAYDGAGNLRFATDGRGWRTERRYDPADRLESVLVTPAAGTPVEGPLAESYAYDGLGRVVRAQSGEVVTERRYDSLSRLTAEVLSGRRVAYAYDDASALIGLTYPSGLQLQRVPDVLGRVAQVRELGQQLIASYGYQGRGLVAAKSTWNGLSGSFEYDPARRPKASRFVGGGGRAVFGEDLRVDARGLKTAAARVDLNGAGLAFGHDGAGRLTVATRVAGPTGSGVEAGALKGLGDLPEVYGFAYDPAQNLLSQAFARSCAEAMVELPPDGSGRNRPGAVDGEALVYDGNGNLIRKGELELRYDHRNRLSRVLGPQGEVVRNEYDAFDRLVAQGVGGVREETVWVGFQPVEDYRDGQLVGRRVYGVGLDEIVRAEADLDGDGVLEAAYQPLYDDTGNLVAVTDGQGRVVERAFYSPYGERTLVVDSTPPAVEQVRVAGGQLLLEVSEEVSLSDLLRQIAAQPFVLQDVASGQALGVQVSQPVLGGRQARRRLAITTTDPPAPGTEVRLVLPAAAFEDLFGNLASQGLDLTFPWPPGDTLLADSTAPRLEEICLEAGELRIEFSEEVDPARAAEVLRLDGSALAWAPSEDRYSLLAPVAAGSHTLTLGAEPLDLAGLGLGEPRSFTFRVDPGERRQVFTAPDPRTSLASTVGNRFGFHGLRHDPATGLVYARKRFFDPQLGRFLSEDPFGFADGPSRYQYALNNPVDRSDPTGEIATNVLGGVVSAGLGFGVRLAFGQEITPEDVVLDFALGFATSGLSSIAALRNVSTAGRFALRAGIETTLDVGTEAARRSLKGEDFTLGELAVGGAFNFALGEVGAGVVRRVLGPTGPRFRELSGLELGAVRGGGEGVRRGSVSGRPEIVRKVRAARAGDLSSAAELEAARALRGIGLEVEFRTPAGDIGVEGIRTSDFLVSGTPFEVFAPTTGNANRVVSQLAKKLPQADRFVLNLSRSPLGPADFANLLQRINNIPGIPRRAQEIILVRDGVVVGRLR